MGETRHGVVVPEEEQKVAFCCMCFADERGGSWGETVIQGHCFNCGAGGTTVWLQKWAVDKIRENASWVGKRYYPCDEDRERNEERSALLALVKEFPGRSVEVREFGYEVRQKKPDGTWVSVTLGYDETKTTAEAFEKARAVLPYVPAEKLT